MEIDIIRFSSGQESTLGLLLIDGEFGCYTLEDEARTEKVFGETRIPAGRYQMTLRTFGEHHIKYGERFPDFHIGMLEILDVPNFTDILIHIGNTDADTAGCLLIGDRANNNLVSKGRIQDSEKAYRRIYPQIIHAFETEEEVWINIADQIPAIESSSVNLFGTVDTSLLNMREQPGLQGLKSGILSKGTYVKIADRKPGWFRVKLEGWVAEDYVKLRDL